MSVLGTVELKRRLDKGEIFKPGTWDPSGIKEASYVLRIAWDGLVVDGDPYPPGTFYCETQLQIEPGRIAVLSTQEVLTIPGDLSGKVGVRLDFAARGLVGLMGIQVDPYYGMDSETDERLYFRVVNMGNEPIRLERGEGVFNIELHDATGACKPKPPRARGWDRIQQLIKTQRDPSWTYITRVDEQAKAIEDRWQPLVLFGVILLAVTVLGVMLAVAINTDAGGAPPWVADWGWGVLVVTFSLGGLATAAIVGVEAWRRSLIAATETMRVWKAMRRRR